MSGLLLLEIASHGPRFAVMLNDCTDVDSRDLEVARHHWPNRVKKFKRLFGIGPIAQKAA